MTPSQMRLCLLINTLSKQNMLDLLYGFGCMFGVFFTKPEPTWGQARHCSLFVMANGFAMNIISFCMTHMTFEVPKLSLNECQTLPLFLYLIPTKCLTTMLAVRLHCTQFCNLRSPWNYICSSFLLLPLGLCARYEFTLLSQYLEEVSFICKCIHTRLRTVIIEIRIETEQSTAIYIH